MSRGLRSYGDRMGAISSNVASNVGNLRMRAADSRARGIEGRGRTFQNLASGLGNMVGQELMARPQRRMAAEDRRMAQEERGMRMDQAQQGLIRGDQQIAMNDAKMNEMREAKIHRQKVVSITSGQSDLYAAAAALAGEGLHEEAAKFTKQGQEQDLLKGKLDAQDLKKWTETNNNWKTLTDFSAVPEDQREAVYYERRRQFLASPFGKEMDPDVLEQFWPETIGPGTFEMLADTNASVTLAADHMKAKTNKVALEQSQLKSMEDWEMFFSKQLLRTATEKGYAAKRTQIMGLAPPEMRAKLEQLIPKKGSKQVRADLKDLVRPERTGSKAASIQEYEYYKGQAVAAGEDPMLYAEFRKTMRLHPDRDNLSVNQALAVLRSIEGEVKSRMDALNGDLAEMEYRQAVEFVAKARGVTNVQDLYALSMGQKPGAEPEAAAETRTGPDGKVYEKGADGLWMEKK